MSLKEVFENNMIEELVKELGLKNRLEVPSVRKIVVNVGIGRINKDEEAMKYVEEGIKAITGLKPVRTLAKKSISAFKIRKGAVVGLKTTLRGKRMYDFMEKLITITLPRVRDFQGLDLKAVDLAGNLIIGFKEQFYFPEITSDRFDKPYGLELVINTKAKAKEHAIALYRKLGIPFKSD